MYFLYKVFSNSNPVYCCHLVNILVSSESGFLIYVIPSVFADITSCPANSNDSISISKYNCPFNVTLYAVLGS